MTHFITAGKKQMQKVGKHATGKAEAIYFEPDSPLYNGYKNAVAAGGNFAIVNRLLLWEGVCFQEGLRRRAGTDLRD